MDIINQLAEIEPGGRLDEVRNLRPKAKQNAQATFTALLEPEDTGAFSYAERYAVAAFVAGLFQVPAAAEFYLDLLGDAAADDIVAAVRQATDRGATRGPAHDAGFVTFQDIDGADARLSAAFDFAHLLVFHPQDARPAALGHLEEAGWDADGIVSLAQLIAFLAFQVRVVHGLRVLGGKGDPAGNTAGANEAANVTEVESAGADSTSPGWHVAGDVIVPEVHAPEGFVNHSLGWKPWIPAVAKEDMTPQQIDALIKPERVDSEYFRLLARAPEALRARTETDLDIFYNTDGGMARAERELAATVVSRLNGCAYCASVHQARCVDEGGDREVVDRLLDEGVDTDLGSDYWSAIRNAAVALTRTPSEFTAKHIDAVRAAAPGAAAVSPGTESAGHADAVVIDLINCSSFFNWANRLMLTLGEPDVPRRFR